jgi:hypothetical protein
MRARFVRVRGCRCLSSGFPSPYDNGVVLVGARALAAHRPERDLAPTADEKPKRLWVNRDNVLYIQDVSDQELPFGFVG